METNMYLSTVSEGITFRAVRETRFKNACIGVHFFFPLKREFLTLNAILIAMLRRSCARYPEYNELRRAHAMLYGADSDTSAAIIGNCQMISVEMEMTDDRFIPDGECISGECAGLLSEMIFRPAVGDDGGLFRQDDLDVVLRNAEERIKSLIIDKESYASHRCYEIMCEGEAAGLEPGGYLEDLPGITREALAQAWERMLTSSMVEIIVVGGMDYKPVERIFKKEFGAITRRPAPLPTPPAYKEAETIREVTERVEEKQSRMIMGYRLPVIEPDDRTMAARLMSLMFGGGTASLLFKHVREKLSLCYYCSSSYGRTSGLLFVRSGIDEVNYNQAIDEIKKQLAVIAENAFSDDEFNAARLVALSAFENISDSVSSIESWYANQYLDGCVRTPAQAAERMMAVTREQLAECASLARLDTIYMLSPELSGQSGDEREGGEEP